MVRTQPRLYAEKYIKPLLPFYQGVYFRHPGQIPVVTSEGKAALVDCIEALQESEPCGIIHPSNGLTFAAQKHLKDQSKSGDLGHIGADGSSPFERMSNYGEWQHLAVENIDYGNNSPREIVISLLIDDGVPGRGHRKNILNKELNFIGVAFGSHPNYGHMCVMDLAGGFMEN